MRRCEDEKMRRCEDKQHDQHGHPHTVTQAEGGEQGDPLMPVLFSLAQQPALQAVQTRLQPGESLYAFLDDVYAVAPPHRVRPIYDLLEHHLFAEARIRLNSGKTRVWNQGGRQPPHISSLGEGVWVGDHVAPAEQRGITVLGAPLGTQAYIQASLAATLAKHMPLLQSIPTLHDLQASWLLLLFTASPRCNYLLRLLPPELTRQFAQDHDAAVTTCLAQLLDHPRLPATAIARAHLPLSQGPWTLPSVIRSCAGILGIVGRRPPSPPAASPSIRSNTPTPVGSPQRRPAPSSRTTSAGMPRATRLKPANMGRTSVGQHTKPGTTTLRRPHPTRVAAHRSNTPASHCPRRTL